MSSSHTHFPFILTFLLISITITPSKANFSEELVLEPIITTRTEKTTLLHFYFHDIHSGSNPTAVQVIGDEGFGFGTTFMMDNSLTQEPERDSQIVGRAQGFYSLAAQNDMALLMVVTFAFTEGKYNGSSISMLGRNHILDDVREMPIVGGSGLFRFSTGYALAHTVWFDSKTGDATVEYNVTVQHF